MPVQCYIYIQLRGNVIALSEVRRLSAPMVYGRQLEMEAEAKCMELCRRRMQTRTTRVSSASLSTSASNALRASGT